MYVLVKRQNNGMIVSVYIRVGYFQLQMDVFICIYMVMFNIMFIVQIILCDVEKYCDYYNVFLFDNMQVFLISVSYSVYVYCLQFVYMVFIGDSILQFINVS